jgi:hypothetical protein
MVVAAVGIYFFLSESYRTTAIASPIGLPFSASFAAAILHRKAKISTLAPIMSTLRADGVITVVSSLPTFALRGNVSDT